MDEKLASHFMGRIVGTDVLLRRVLTQMSLFVISSTSNNKAATDRQVALLREWIDDLSKELVEAAPDFGDRNVVTEAAITSTRLNLEAAINEIEAISLELSGAAKPH